MGGGVCEICKDKAVLRFWKVLERSWSLLRIRSRQSVLLARYGSRKDGYVSSDVTVGVGDRLGGSGRQFGLF